jgi:glutamate racemase
MFDSGFGGLTVARALIDLLPAEDLVYLGDTGRYPYGPRDLDEVARFAHQITEELVERRGVKLVVVAPGVRAIGQATLTGRIGVIGTVGTINSGAYQAAVAAEVPDAELVALACPGFVEFVERGEFDSEQVHVLATALLAPAKEAKVDALLLGCTHYPYLARTLSDVMGRDVVLVSSADETAFEVRRLMLEGELATRPAADGARGSATFITTGDVNWFEELGRRLLGPELERAEHLYWD